MRHWGRIRWLNKMRGLWKGSESLGKCGGAIWYSADWVARGAWPSNSSCAAERSMANALSSSDVYSLLSKLCIDLGFCLPPDEIARLQESPPSSVELFADAVFLAEGLDPDAADQSLRKQVRAQVALAFESAQVS